MGRVELDVDSLSFDTNISQWSDPISSSKVPPANIAVRSPRKPVQSPPTMALNSTLVKSTGVAALGGLLFGFDTAVISGTTQSLTPGLPPDAVSARRHRLQRDSRHHLRLDVRRDPRREIWAARQPARAGDPVSRLIAGLRLRLELVARWFSSALSAASASAGLRYWARPISPNSRPRNIAAGWSACFSSTSSSASCSPIFRTTSSACSISAPTNGAGSSPFPPLPRFAVLRDALRDSAQPALACEAKTRR